MSATCSVQRRSFQFDVDGFLPFRFKWTAEISPASSTLDSDETKFSSDATSPFTCIPTPEAKKIKHLLQVSNLSNKTNYTPDHICALLTSVWWPRLHYISSVRVYTLSLNNSVTHMFTLRNTFTTHNMMSTDLGFVFTTVVLHSDTVGVAKSLKCQFLHDTA